MRVLLSLSSLFVIILISDLPDILEIVTPVGMKVVVPLSPPLFGSFASRHRGSSEGFLATLTPQNSEDSILSLDFSPGEPHNPSLRRGIITRRSSLGTKVEELDTRFSRLPLITLTRLVRVVIGPGEEKPSLSLVPGSTLSESPRLGREERFSAGGFNRLDVMNPGSEVVLEAKNPTDEFAGNGRNHPKVRMNLELSKIILSWVDNSLCSPVEGEWEKHNRQGEVEHGFSSNSYK